MNKETLIYFLVAFGLALAAAPILIDLLKRAKARQEILKYVDWHKSKTGTPTMGGWIFILPLIVLCPFILDRTTPLGTIAVIAAVSYGLLGFFDDFLKVRRADNLGLRAYQKIIGQGGIAVLVGVFYYMANPEGRILIPFANVTWDIGFWILPLTILVLVATTNAVNLTDGVDGLAASVSLVYLLFLGALVGLVSAFMPLLETNTIFCIIAIVAGGILCYLLFNTNKAKVFMGDTGSLFLGGLIACLSLFSLMGLFIIILGAMFVLSALSDIIQVAYFKLTHGKRVFLMAPFHHHLEKKGWTEARICALYCICTALAGVFCLLTFVK